MKPKIVFFLSLLAVVSLSTPASCQDEHITLSTYYPAPFGDYDQLCSERLLVWRPDAAELQDMREGDCHIGWSLIVGAGGTGFSYDEIIGGLGDGVALIKDRLGIGTTGPTQRLQFSPASYIGLPSNGGWNIPAGWRRGNAGGIILAGSANPNGTGWAYGSRIINHDYGNGLALSFDVLTGGAWTNDVLVISGRAGSNGNVGIGTTGPTQKLDVAGSIAIAEGAYIGPAGFGHNSGHDNTISFGQAGGAWGGVRVINYFDGSFNNQYVAFDTHHGGVSVGERMRIDRDGNVGIGTTNPQAKLDVNGVIKAKGFDTTVYTAGGPGAPAATLSSANTWADFPDLSITFSLSQPTTVIAHYEIAMLAGGGGGPNSHLCTRLVVDGAIVSRSLTGNVAFWSEDDWWGGELTAGSHTIKVQYRTPGGGTNNPAGTDYQNRVLQVVVLGS